MTHSKTDEIDVRYVADLARIELTDEEAETFQRELGEIVGYVRLLAEADVDGIEPTAHAMPVVNVLREDSPTPSLDRDAVLANAPAVIADTCVRVPAILPTEEEGA